MADRDWADDLARMMLGRGALTEEGLAMAFRASQIFCAAMNGAPRPAEAPPAAIHEAPVSSRYSNGEARQVPSQTRAQAMLEPNMDDD